MSDTPVITSPALRFGPDGAEWEKRPFENMARRRSASSSASGLPRIEYEDIVSFQGRFNKDVFKKKAEKTGIVFEENDVLFGKLRPYLGNWLLAPFKGIAVGDWWVLQALEICPEFLYVLIQSPDFQKVANQSTGSKMPRADWSLVSMASFSHPCSPSEQRKIGAFFRAIERLLAAREEELGKLEALKKAMLEKMFPQENAKVPEVRFKEFQGEWEETELGSLFAERDSRTEEGRLLSVTRSAGIIFASDNGRYDNSNVKSGNYKRVECGDLVYNTMRMWQGACGVSPHNGIVSPAYTVLVPSPSTDAVFFEYEFKLPTMLSKFRMNSQGMTSDTWNLKYYLFAPITAKFPSYQEQQKIGRFFRSLDALIEARRKELGKLKELRAGLLERMFA